MPLITALGLAAGTLTTAAFVPQVIKTWKSKSAEDLSLGMYLIFCIGTTLWLTYGFIRSDLPIIMANFVTLCLSFVLIYFKLKYRDQG